MKYVEWLEKWLKFYVKPVVKERTYYRYKRVSERELNAVLGETEIEKLTTLQLQQFVAGLFERGLAASSINGIISVIKSSLKSAVVAGIVSRNSANGIQRVKQEEIKAQCFTLKEQKKIEQYIFQKKDVRLYGIVLTFYSGLRIGEMLSLKWTDVDFVKKKINVAATCRDGWENGRYIKILDTPKTQTSKRIIPIPKTLLPLLREMKEQGKCDYVITGRTQYGAEVRCYQKTFEQLLRKLNISHKGFHALRHTFATRALESGMDVKTLSEILGHKNTAITLNRYVHSLDEHKVDMMNRLGKLLQ